MVDPIHLFIVDKHAGIREGIRRVGDEHPNMIVVGEAAEFDEILSTSHHPQPDVLVLGLNVLPVPIIEVADKFRDQLPTTKLLIYAETCDDFCLQSLLDAGVSGCVLKEDPVDELVTAIQVIADGGTYFSRPALTGLAQTESETTLNPLTAREQEVLQIMAQGMSNQQIAEILSIATRTVKFHTANIYDKLGGLSRAETIAWAWKNGIVKGDGA